MIGPMGIAADWHLPLTDYAYANVMIDKFEQLGITTLGIPGDFFNMDALSRYEPKQETADLQREVHEGQVVMDRLLDIFDRVVFTKGNHDVRIAASLGYKIQFRHAVALLFGEIDATKRDRLLVSNLDYFWNRPYPGADDSESWYVCHPQNYSNLPGAVGRALAGKLGCNVLTAHSHHAAILHAANGTHVVGELGGLHDRRVTAYLQGTTKFANWNQGYAWIDAHNKLHMDSPRWAVG